VWRVYGRRGDFLIDCSAYSDLRLLHYKVFEHGFSLSGVFGCQPTHVKSLRMLERRFDSITLDGKHIPFHHPHTQPYTYLGVEITTTLNWEQQKKEVITELQAKCEIQRVLSSFTSPTQTLKYFQNSIRPYVTYAFPTGIYNPQDIRELDSALARFAKRALYLPLYTPNAIILEKVKHTVLAVLIHATFSKNRN